MLLLTQMLAYQRYQILKGGDERELQNQADAVKERLEAVVRQSVSTTQALGAIIQRYGIPADFDTIAAELLHTNTYIDAIQVVPNGVIAHTYPPQGHETSIGYNILADTLKNKGAYTAIRSRSFYFAGPLELKQGGKAVIGRWPVFANDTFWGFTAVIIRLPSLLNTIGINDSAHKGFTYQLSRINPETGKEEYVLPTQQHSAGQLSVPINLPNGEWKLYISPHSSTTANTVIAICILGLMLSLMAGAMTWYVTLQPYKLNAQVHEKTAELEQKTDALEHSLEQNKLASLHQTSILNALPAYIALLDDKGNIVAINEAWKQEGIENNSNGFRNVVGDNYIEAFETLQGSSSTDALIVATGIRKLLAGQIQEFIHEYACNSLGYTRWFRVTVSPTYDGKQMGAVVMHLNITETKQAENKIRASEERYRLVSENPILGIAWASDEGRILNANAAYCAMLGYSPLEMLDMHVSEFTHPEDFEPETTLYQKLISGEENSVRYEKRYITKQGNIMWGELILSAIKDSQGKVRYSIGIINDITARKKAEQELKDLNESLEKIVEERTAALKEANKELEAFSYTVSHDLRAPLRSISGFASLIEKRYGETIGADGKEYIEKLNNSVKLMSALIDDLLSFSRIGKASMNLRTTNMNEVVQVALSELLPLYPPTAVMVNPLPTAQCDTALIKQVWINLISNALKYSSKTENAKVEIGCQTVDDEDVYYVKDNGAGFDMQFIDKLFSVFKRLHSAEEFEGTGVGLATVKRIVTRHGGKVWAEAKLDEGATFYFTLGSAMAHTQPVV
jgi:PAS domain S-box-containing protein